MKKTSLLILFLLSSLFCKADESNLNTTDLSTPYRTLSYLDTNLKQGKITPVLQIIKAPNVDIKEKKRYLKSYQQIWKGNGIMISPDDAPDRANYLDTLSQSYRYVIHPMYPSIYLQKIGDQWVFPLIVLQEIDRIHDELFKFKQGLLFEKKAKGTVFGENYLGLELWQWTGVLIILILSILIRVIFSLIFEKAMLNGLKKVDKAHLGEKYILPVARPTATMVVFLFIALMYPFVQLPESAGYYILLMLKGLIPLFGMIILYRLVNILEIYANKLVKKSESTWDDQLVPLLKKVLKVVIVITGGLIIMDSLDIPILPLLTGLSIGGLAFALAAQDTIKNFFGSIMILIDRPFQVGDWITTKQLDGTVEEVGFRSTRVRTFRNSLVYVPNGMLADSVVDNNGLRQFRRFKTMIAIKYDTPPERIEIFVEGLKKILHQHSKTNKEKYEIHLNEMGPNSLNVLFYIFFHAPTWSEELQFRQEIILAILKLAKRLSVHFAFPTQTLHVENLPGKESLSPVYTLTREDLDNRLNEFFDERDGASNRA